LAINHKHLYVLVSSLRKSVEAVTPQLHQCIHNNLRDQNSFNTQDNVWVPSIANVTTKQK